MGLGLAQPFQSQTQVAVGPQGHTYPQVAALIGRFDTEHGSTFWVRGAGSLQSTWLTASLRALHTLQAEPYPALVEGMWPLMC
eukprot:scaffold38669_cov20-Tisochrysis_lutea.AAC.2